jgi:hypothetical protein
MFESQVAAASKEGIDYITLHAAGGPNQGMNGYYTWPRFGFDQPIDALESGRVKRMVAERYPDAKTVLDVFSTPGGAEWWKENGTEMHQAKFDMTPGSRSRRVFEAYLAAKKSLQAHFEGGKPNAV